MAKQRTDALRLLEQQHREVENLFERYADTEEPQRQLELFELLADRLAAHTRIEEEIFYPEVFDKESEDMLRESVEEHLTIKRLIADLLEMTPEDEQFDAKMELMEELVSRHVDKEEEVLFATVRRDAEHEAMLELGDRLSARYRELMAQEPRRAVPGQTGSAASL